MELIDDYIAAKRQLAAHYIAGIKDIDGLTAMAEAPWATSVFWLFTIQVDPDAFGMDSRSLLSELARFGIQSRPLWQPMHLSPALRGCQAWHCEVGSRIHRRALCLPSSVGLKSAQQERVLEALRKLAVAH